MEMLAEALNYMEEYEEACAVLEEIIDIRRQEESEDIIYEDPTFMQLYRSLAGNYQASGNYNKAIDAL
jgi:tetratricopeptide (TPR) repeat protein